MGLGIGGRRGDGGGKQNGKGMGVPFFSPARCYITYYPLPPNRREKEREATQNKGGGDTKLLRRVVLINTGGNILFFFFCFHPPPHKERGVCDFRAVQGGT